MFLGHIRFYAIVILHFLEVDVAIGILEFLKMTLVFGPGKIVLLRVVGELGFTEGK